MAGPVHVSTYDKVSAFGFARRNIAHDPVFMFGRDHRADRCIGIKRIAQFESINAFEHFIQKFINQRRGYDLAHVGRTVLAAVPERRHCGMLDQIIADHSVIQNNKRAFAAHFQPNAFEIAVTGITHEQTAHFG